MCTISFRANCGNGTKPNKKHSGKRTDREAREPKQRMKDPTHDSTSANILIESCTSEGSEVDHHFIKPATTTDIASKAAPAKIFGATIDFRDPQSRRIRATLMEESGVCAYMHYPVAPAQRCRPREAIRPSRKLPIGGTNSLDGAALFS